MKLDNPFQLSP